MRCATPVISATSAPYLAPVPPRIHDLLEIDAERFLEANRRRPAWVAESLRTTPFVVVRRGPISDSGGNRCRRSRGATKRTLGRRLSSDISSDESSHPRCFWPVAAPSSCPQTAPILSPPCAPWLS